MIDKNVLRENDIRGIAGVNITETLAFRVGASFGTYLINNNKFECVIGYDNRTSGEVLVKSLINGLMSTGINVKFIGMVTTPILNYATIHLNIEAGIIVTASHNPAKYNGYKVYWDDGAQIISPVDKQIIENVRQISSYDQIKITTEEDQILIKYSDIDPILYEMI